MRSSMTIFWVIRTKGKGRPQRVGRQPRVGKASKQSSIDVVIDSTPVLHLSCHVLCSSP